MKIRNTTKVGSIGPLRRVERKRTETAEIHESREIQDTVSVFGIPAEEMTPKVEAAIMQLMEEVNNLREELRMARRRLDELEVLADRDTLVPASNRRAFVRELTRIIAFSERYGTPCSLLYFDLNDLKKINDQYGHAAGDAALQIFTEILDTNTRDSDVLGRIGGDEFAVILLNTDQADAVKKAEALNQVIAATALEWEGQEVTLNAAYGVYSIRPGVDAAKAIAEADRAMYARKRQCKDDEVTDK